MAKIQIPVPQGANERAAKLWTSIVTDYSEDLTDTQIELLERLVQVIKIVDDAVEILDAEGITFIDKSLQPKEHPSVKTMKEFISLEKSLITQLYLDVDDDDEPV